MTLDVPSPTSARGAMPEMCPTAMAGDDVSDREHLLKRLNQAVRRPAEFGGLREVVRLLDLLAASDGRGREQVWIPDTNARLAPSMMLREGFPAPEIHVTASQYGEDAHRRGWLCLDRTLTAAEHSAIVGSSATWSGRDRSLHEIVAEFGPPSVTFGSTDPDRPKTLSYATSDRRVPVVAFHLGSAGTETEAGSGDGPAAGAVLLAVRVNDDLLGGWELTPSGEITFAER